MALQIDEILSTADKLENMLRAVVDDRLRAWGEVDRLSHAMEERDMVIDRLKKSLDERETEYLQLDEEHQRVVKSFEEEREAMANERAEASRQFDEVAARIRSLIPLLPEINAAGNE